MSARKQHLLLYMALLLLVTAWASGCGGEATPGVPSDEPSAAPAQTEVSSGLRETTSTAIAVPTVAPQREEAEITPTPNPAAAKVEPSNRAEQVIQLAREDLAQRLSLTPEAIRVLSLEKVEWPDASLGCPKPGMMYAQVITPGYSVVLEAEGKPYEYHTDTGRVIVRCDEGKP